MLGVSWVGPGMSLDRKSDNQGSTTFNFLLPSKICVLNFFGFRKVEYILNLSNSLQYRQKILVSDVPEVLNVHVNENKKTTVFRKTFFASSEKLTFEKENAIF